MDFRKVDGGGGGESGRKSEIQTLLGLADLLANSENKGSGQTDLIKRMLRKAESSDSHLVPLIEAYLMGLLLGAGPDEERDEDA